MIVCRRTVERTLAAVAESSVQSTRRGCTIERSIDEETHHPGPPRFMHAGETISDPLGHEGETRDSLAPQNPDVDAHYAWSIADAPDGAIADEAILSGDAVVEFDPEVPGTYRLELDAPDGTHSLTVRVYPAEDEPDPRPRLTLDADVVDGEVTLEATASNAGVTSADAELAVEFFVDDRHHDRLPEQDSPIGPGDLTDRVRVYAVAVDSRHSVPAVIDLVPDGDALAVDHPGDPPDWVENAVIYEIFTRRFPDQDEPTFETIADRITHLAALGVDAVWMTPLLATDRGFGTLPAEGGPHGYHITDYFATDPDLGTIEAFEALVDTCHDHGIKVIFDLVINHTADTHPFARAAMNADHPDHETYVDWYRWTERDASVPEYYFGWSGIFNLNYANPAVRAFALDVIDVWASKVDGIRADVAWGVPHGFWLEVAERLERADSDFLLLDETIPYDVDYARSFDLHYDDELETAINEAAEGEPGAILDAIDRRASVGAPEDALFMQYAENHDTDRYLAKHGQQAQRAAVAATFTLPGVPLVYYGQETGLRRWREPMNWGEFDADLVAFHRQLVDLYHDHPALGPRGGFERIPYQTSGDGVVAFARNDPESGQRLVIVLNFAPGTARVTIAAPVENTDLLTGSSVPIGSREGETAVPIDSVLVLPVTDTQ